MNGRRPTDFELEWTGYWAEHTVWTEKHTCRLNWEDINGKPSPAACFSSLEVERSNYVLWLAENLPHPFHGLREIGGMKHVKYVKAIDKGRGKEVAAAIRSLKVGA